MGMTMSSWMRMTRIYEKGNKFKGFHCHASQTMSRKSLLAGFLFVWLKKCVVPSPPHDGIFLLVLFLTVQLVYRRPLRLLPAMVCCIQCGLRTLTKALCRPLTTRRGMGQILPCDRPCPRVELPFTYLMA